MSAVLEHPQRHAVTTDEYLRMGEAGIFDPDARLELIEGEIVEMAPIGSPHASVVNTLTAHFFRLLGDTVTISVQSPLIVGNLSVPQPDLALLKPRLDRYFNAHPVASDVLLVVEVSDTTLRFDVGTKIPLYARFEIAEAWVVDVQAREVRVFRDPAAGGYHTTFSLSDEQSVTAIAVPEIIIEVSSLFPR